MHVHVQCIVQYMYIHVHVRVNVHIHVFARGRILTVRRKLFCTQNEMKQQIVIEAGTVKSGNYCVVNRTLDSGSSTHIFVNDDVIRVLLVQCVHAAHPVQVVVLAIRLHRVVLVLVRIV